MAWNGESGNAWTQGLEATFRRQAAVKKSEKLKEYEDIPCFAQTNNTNANNEQNLEATIGSTLSESLMELEEDPEDGYFSTESQIQATTYSADSVLWSWRQHKPCRRQLFESDPEATSEMTFNGPSETSVTSATTFEVSKLLPAPTTTTEKAASYWKAGTEDSSETLDFEDRQLDELKSLIFFPYDDQQDGPLGDPGSDFQQDRHREKALLRSFKCKTCGAKFKFLQWLKAHERRHCETQLPCNFCGKKFPKKILLKLHLSKHKQQQKRKQLQRSSLSKNSRSIQNSKQKEQLKKQYASVRAVKGQERVFECPHCPKVYRSRQGCFEHQSVHTGKKYPCQQCGKVCGSKRILVYHQMVHTGKKYYYCPHCSKQYSTQQYLAQHVKKKHFRHQISKPSIVSEAHECNICFSKFETYGDLRVHRRIHFGGNPYECFVCGLKFPGEKELQLHRKSHKVNGDKPFDCHICGNEYTKKSTLQLHLKNAHSDKREVQATSTSFEFQCAHCPKVFCRLVNLRKHEKSHVTMDSGDDISTGANKMKPFQCPNCKKNFTKQIHLEHHMPACVHSGEKPFKCAVCGRKFRVKKTLEEHVMEHSGEKPFKCSMCSLSFIRKRNLEAHELKHTEVRPFKCSVCGCSYPTSVSLKLHQSLSHSRN